METMLSIIIPTHNRSADVLENLAALVPQCRDEPIEIIVVDSASNPAEAAILRDAAKDGEFKLIRMDAPGASRARNAGIALAKGPWLGFLDDDAVPHSDWVARAMSRIHASADNVGVIAGRALPRWPDSPVARGFKPENLGPRARILVSIIDDPDVYRCDGAPLGISANLLLRKEALAKIGGTAWLRHKKAAERAVEDLAVDMLQVQAAREARPATDHRAKRVPLPTASRAARPVLPTEHSRPTGRPHALRRFPRSPRRRSAGGSRHRPPPERGDRRRRTRRASSLNSR